MKLPKNMKQVGTPEAGDRIYIEDYVATFLARLGDKKEHCGLLLGNRVLVHGMVCYFIFGAMEVENLWTPVGNCIFSEQQWRDAKQTAEKLFHDAQVCGWYIVRKKGEETVPSEIKDHHKNAFPSVNGVLILREEEDQFLFYGAGGEWQKKKGYYEYYERNEAMQNYMMSFFSRKPLEVAATEPAMENFRKRIQEKKEEKQEKSKYLYRIAGVLAAVAVVFAVVNGVNYDRLQEMRAQASSVASVNASIGSNSAASVNASVSATLPAATTVVESGSEEVGDGTKTQDSQESEASTDGETSQASQSAAGSETSLNASGETPVVAQVAVVYQVQPGDTLSEICMKRYGNTSRLEEICLLNNILNENLIATGQKIVLP